MERSNFDCLYFSQIELNGSETDIGSFFSNQEYLQSMSDPYMCSWSIAGRAMLQTMLQTTPWTDIAKDDMETSRIDAVE